MAETFDEQLQLADVYAAALFALATEQDVVPAVRDELAELVRLMEIEPGFASFLSSGAVDDDHRRASLEKMFRGKLSDLMLNTLHVMNDHGRVHLLRALLRAYVLRQEHAAGQIEVRAKTAVPLSDDQKEQVRQLAAELSGKEPLMEFDVEPGMIGGLIVQVEDYRFDDSLRRHLMVARQQLFERGERGLQVGAES